MHPAGTLQCVVRSRRGLTGGRADFFVPVKALSKIFRAKFRDQIARAGLLHLVDPAVWEQDWVVHSQPVGDGRASLKYLAPYVFRVAISDYRIVACDEQTVTFSYRKSGSRRWRKMTLEPHESGTDAQRWSRRFLQHVLPAGFQKVRHYGFLSPNSRVSVESVRWLITLAVGLLFRLLAQPVQTPIWEPPCRCPDCGGPLCRVGLILPGDACYFDTS
jgi:hypothetical protein